MALMVALATDAWKILRGETLKMPNIKRRPWQGRKFELSVKYLCAKYTH